MENLEKMITKYCGSLEDRFSGCKDKNVAEMLKDRVFWEFKQANQKTLNLEDVNDYLNTLIIKKFIDKKK